MLQSFPLVRLAALDLVRNTDYGIFKQLFRIKGRNS